MFMVMMLHRYFTKQLLIETKHLEAFDAEAATHITLYGFAKHMYEYFCHEPKIKFLPWPEWCKYEGNSEECEHTYYHIVRSGVFSIEKNKAAFRISA